MRRGQRVAAALAAAAAPLPFLPALRAGFLAWDDQANLVFNSAYAGFSRASLAWMWTTHFRGPWQPLSWLSYAVDRALWGLDAAAFRRTNLLLHAAAAALAALVARRLLDAALPRAPERARALGALAASLFFAAHPLRVESVVWVTERRDVLSGALLLAAWLARLEGAAVAGPALFAAALLAKGTAVALPFFLLAAEVFPLGRLDPDPRRWTRAPQAAVLRGLAPYFALAAAAGLMNLAGFGSGDLQTPVFGWPLRAAVALHAVGFYLAKTAVPVGLSPYYPMLADASALAPRLAAYAALGVAVTAAAWTTRRRAPWAWTAWLAYLAALAPVSGLLQNGAQIAADRYSYLACLPFAFVVGGVVAAAALRRPQSAAAAVAAGALALGALSWRQSGYWRDDRALWTRAAALAPDGYLPRANLAAALLAAGDEDGAFAQYPLILRLHPDDFGAALNYGVLLEKRGRYDSAEASFRAALAARPDSAQARFDLGLLLRGRGRRRESEIELREAFRLDPALRGRLSGRTAL